METLDLSSLTRSKAPVTGSSQYKSFTFLDGDTVTDDEGNLLRIQGLSLPEIMHSDSMGPYKAGAPGGWQAKKEIEGLANKLGFNKIVYLTNPNGTPMMDATGTRQLIEIKDDKGRDFVQQLNLHNIGAPTKYTTDDQLISYLFGEAKQRPKTQGQNLNEFEKAKLAIDQTIASEKLYGIQAKKIAEDEAELARLNAPRQRGESIEAFAFRKEQAKDFTRNIVQKRNPDRTLLNKALHPWSESFDVGWTGAIEGMYGAVEMIGEKTDWNWVEAIGKDGVQRQREYLSNKPELKMSLLKPKLDAVGNAIGNEWDVGGLGGFFEYVGNMAAMSLPYMGVTFAGATLAPVTGGSSLAAATGIAAAKGVGVSMLAPVAMYAGQTWNEMEGDNKSAGLASAAGVTMAVLDRLGIKGLMGTTKGTILDKETREQMVDALVERSYRDQMADPNVEILTRDQAKAILARMTRLESVKLLENSAEIAKQQLQYRNVLRALGTRAGQGFAIESSTEVGQELTGYLAAVYGSDKPFDAVELNDRLINAAIAGGTLGSGFSIPGTAIDYGAWADVAVRQAPAEAKRLSQEGAWSVEAEVDKDANTGRGRQQSVDELSEQAKKNARRKKSKKGRTKTPYQFKEEQGRKELKGRDAWERTTDAAQSINMLWKGAMPYVFWPLAKKYKAMRKLGSFYNGFLHRIYSGGTFEEQKHLQLSKYRNLVDSPAVIAKAAGMKTISQPEISNLIEQFTQWAKNKNITVGHKQQGGDGKVRINNRVRWNTLPANLKKHEVWLKDYALKVAKLSDMLHEDQRKAREEFSDGKLTGKQFNVGWLPNYLLTYKSFNKAAIEKDKNKFINALVKKGLSLDQATDITNSILENRDSVDFDNEFNVGKGRFIPANHKARTMNLATDPDFNEFMEKDAFINISNAAKSASRYIAYQKFVGDNSEIINELIEEAMDEGMTEKEANRLAVALQDYLNAESGNYKRMSNDTLSRIQKNLLIWTTLAGLPLATVSSFVELMMVNRALSPEQIQKTMKGSAKEFAEAAWSTLINPRLSSTQQRLEKEKRQANLKRLGFFDWDVGAAQTTGATENTYASRYLLDKYFRLIGLQQWTDYTRNIRAGIADTFILDHLDTIRNQRQLGLEFTNEIQEAEEQLRNLGINVNRLLELTGNDVVGWTQAEASEFTTMMDTARFNFVNEAIALPGTANRPLFYQNPHLALFTQFQGFIATFTANIIPRLWGDYVKRGTPSMKYNAFAIMSTMILLGFVSQYLKDLLKYGTATPYLSRAEKIQRGIGSSGLIGVAERPLDFFFPIYETSSSGNIEWFFNTVSGEAAALSNVTRAAKGAVQIVEGKTEPGVYKLLKTTPVIGPFNQLNRWVAQFFG